MKNQEVTSALQSQTAKLETDTVANKEALAKLNTTQKDFEDRIQDGIEKVVSRVQVQKFLIKSNLL